MDFLLPVLIAILGIALIFYLFIAGNGTSTVKRSGLDKITIRKKWEEIEKSIASGNTSYLNSAVMEADKLFDYVLKGVTGNKQGTMGDRLKMAQKRFSDYSIYQGVWEAHKVRNRLAHEINAEIMSLESKRAVEKFKKGLKDLKIL